MILLVAEKAARVVDYMFHIKTKLLAFPWVNFNAVWIVRTAIIHSSLLILFQNEDFVTG